MTLLIGETLKYSVGYNTVTMTKLMYRSVKNEAISMAECLSRVILSEGHHPRSASFLDHVQTDAVYFGDGNVSALQLN